MGVTNLSESYWNPWHGCHKLSPGCQNCYMYRTDARHGRDSSKVEKTQSFSLPIKRDRKGSYKILPGTLVWTCFTSDFFVEEADQWRGDAWAMMKERSDLTFLFITKRIDRLSSCLPPDWGDGYDNVRILCTVENQDRADYRLPILRDAPVKYKGIVCEPLLESLDLRHYLGPWVRQVVAGGESGEEARPCHYEWIMELRRQCIEAGVSFYFKQTGALFIKDERAYRIKRQFQHSQARRANINYSPEEK